MSPIVIFPAVRGKSCNSSDRETDLVIFRPRRKLIPHLSRQSRTSNKSTRPKPVVFRTFSGLISRLKVTGIALGATVNRKWFALSAAVAGFLLQHAIQGWCPPMPIMRSLGIRTVSEIDNERYALEDVRGDFQNVVRRASPSSANTQVALVAARSPSQRQSKKQAQGE